MTPTITLVRLTGAADRAERPLLVLGPSLGTSAKSLWTGCAGAGLTDHFDVVAWDLPGHGHNHAVPDEPVSMADLAAGVVRVLDDVQEQRGDLGGPFFYAGDSVGGAVGLQLLLDQPDRVTAAAIMCSGAKIGDAALWADRIEAVRASGTPGLVASAAQRWFAPGFLERYPDVGSAMLHALSDADPEGYVRVCEALAGYDLREWLPEITAPVLGVAGAHDVAAPVEGMRLVAEQVKDGRLVVLDDVGHMAPAEAPEQVAQLLLDFFLGDEALRGSLALAPQGPGNRAPEERGTSVSKGDVYEQGMSVRRAVLGDAHVDRAVEATTPFTEDFQRFITEYAWGSVWTRPGLDRRSRSMITLTALIARGHDDELAMHVRAARTNGLTDDEIKEVILHSAIYCGVPAANTAFRIAKQVLEDPS
jgi:3-oxoadipate enol-lactonase/4-carboxymuconolactone decarboxylase